MKVQPGRDRVGEAPSAGACAANLVQLGSLISAELDRRFRRRGLSGAAFNLLRVLSASGGSAFPYEISERLSVSRATVTGLLDSLEHRQLVRRMPDVQDRRMLRVEMTRPARTLLAQLLPEHDQALGRMFAGLPARDQRRLVVVLGRLQGQLRERASGSGRR